MSGSNVRSSGVAVYERGTEGAVDTSLCSVCDERPATAGGLVCSHHFCPVCFGRYVAGSVAELHTRMRCCVCGTVSPLVVEIGAGHSTLCFGRHEHQPKLQTPVGIAYSKKTGFIIVDRKCERVYSFTDQGRRSQDFGYLYNTTPTGGLVLTPGGEIAVSFQTASYDCISFFSPEGRFSGSAYVTTGGGDVRPDIRGITCCPRRGVLYAADASGKAVHVIDLSTKLHTQTFHLEPIQFETPPEPRGLAVTSTGDLLIADVANHCVKRYSSSGHFLQKIGSRGERPLEFESPTGVAVTSTGELLVADGGNQRVQRLDSRGHFRRFVIRYRQGDDMYMAPTDVVVTETDDIAVLLTSTQTADVAEVRLYK